jgi:hypothetical protein
MGSRWLFWSLVVVGVVTSVSACSRHHAATGGNLDSPSSEQGGGGTASPTGMARRGKAPADGPPCLVSEVVAEIALTGSARSADLLFVIDDSSSMKEVCASWITSMVTPNRAAFRTTPNAVHHPKRSRSTCTAPAAATRRKATRNALAPTAFAASTCSIKVATI